jgi:hypothetical protein
LRSREANVSRSIKKQKNLEIGDEAAEGCCDKQQRCILLGLEAAPRIYETLLNLRENLESGVLKDE